MSEPEETRPICPECKEVNNVGATRCKHCSSLMQLNDPKECAFCRKLIDGKARKCVHCGEFVNRNTGRWAGGQRFTIWDILGVVLVPLLLIGLASWFPTRQAKEQEEVGALADYLDDVTKILFEQQLAANEPARTSVRIRTMFALRELDENQSRRDVVLRLLRGAELLDWVFLKAQLKGVDLTRRCMNQGSTLFFGR